jgi:hypothetical protein
MTQWVFAEGQKRALITAAALESVTLFQDGRVEGFVRLVDQDGVALQSVPFSFVSEDKDLLLAINHAVFGALVARGVVPPGSAV